MKISTSINGVIKPYGLEAGLKMLAQAGFEAVDYTLSQNNMNWEEPIFQDVSDPAFAEHFKHIGKTTRSCGLELHQSHAPYVSPLISDFELYAQNQKQTVRSIYATGLMECPYIVAHPVLHRDFCDESNRELARQTTLDYFSALVPALKDTGVTMCIENLFFYIKEERRIIPSFGSSAEDLCDIIDTLNEMHGPHFVACVDTGHAAVSKNDPAEMIKTLGSRVKVLHIQDNLGKTDNHLIPTEGIINWKAVALALGEIGYQGTFNFEITKPFSLLTSDTFSRAAFQNACNYLYSIGRSLADIAEGTFTNDC